MSSTLVIKFPNENYKEMFKNWIWENEWSLHEWQADVDCDFDCSVNVSEDSEYDLEYEITQKED